MTDNEEICKGHREDLIGCRKQAYGYQRGRWEKKKEYTEN